MTNLGNYMDKTYVSEESFEDLERWSIVEKEIFKEEQDKKDKEKLLEHCREAIMFNKSYFVNEMARDCELYSA